MRGSRFAQCLMVMLFGTVFLWTAAGVAAQTDCELVDHGADWDARLSFADDARTEAQLRALVLNPTAREARAVATRERGARIETYTDTHAVFPTSPESFRRALTDAARIATFVPHLESFDIPCVLSNGLERQHQRTRFDFLWFQITNDYVIDVQYVENGPDVYSSRWTLVSSLDGSMTYDYGSWFFAAVSVDGLTMTYVRHFARIGLTTAVPGARLVVASQLESNVVALLNAFYEETLLEPTLQ